MAKTVLVTGCRSGFGLLSALAAARAGWRVYAGFRDIGTSEELERQASGLQVTPLQLDVTRGDEREAALHRILVEEGKLDALVNNAGRSLGGFLELVDDDEMRQLMDLNFFSVREMTRVCLPAMREAGRGRIIMVSSQSGRMALPGLGAYAATKHALEGMSEAWRHELRPFGIWVSVIEPGAYKTDIFTRNLWVSRNSEDDAGPYAATGRRIKALFERSAIERAGDPLEVAQLIVRLLDHHRPPFRTRIGPWAKARERVRNFLPFSATELLVQTLLRP